MFYLFINAAFASLENTFLTQEELELLANPDTPREKANAILKEIFVNGQLTDLEFNLHQLLDSDFLSEDEKLQIVDSIQFALNDYVNHFNAESINFASKALN